MSENMLFLTLFPLYKPYFPLQFDEEKWLLQSSLGKINKHSLIFQLSIYWLWIT